MLAETASMSCVCLSTSMFAGSMWPNDRVRGSRTSIGVGSRSGSAGTGYVSPRTRARGCGASICAHRTGESDTLRSACGAPTALTP